jgi:hypothetical protein
MKKPEYFALNGKVIYRTEVDYYLFTRVKLQILFEEDTKFNALMEVMRQNQTIENFTIFRMQQSSPVPPCIIYEPGRKDALFSAKVGNRVEVLFKGIVFGVEDYVMKVHTYNPPIAIERTSIIG